jgi:hypothetical protein
MTLFLPSSSAVLAQTIAFSDSLAPRMLGISLSSFSSGLGELTFLQLSSSYPSNQSLGGFASGTGGAGIVGPSLILDCLARMWS